MRINVLKVVLAFVLVVVLIVAIGLGWIEDAWGYGTIALLIGYIIGNARVTSQEGMFTPIVKRSQ